MVIGFQSVGPILITSHVSESTVRPTGRIILVIVHVVGPVPVVVHVIELVPVVVHVIGLVPVVVHPILVIPI